MSDWLDSPNPNPLGVERRCDELMRDLTRFLEWQHDDPEAAAQETLRRGLAEIAAGAAPGFGPRAYLFGVAGPCKTRQGWWPEPLAEDGPPGGGDHEPLVTPAVDALGRLNAHDRLLIVRYCTENDHAAHCRELGVPPATLRSIVHRVRKQIRATAL